MRNITLYEVGPRDGLQNEARPIPTEEKIALVNLLSGAGFRRIECASFVSPKWVPQLADAAAWSTRVTCCNQKGAKVPARLNAQENRLYALPLDPAHHWSDFSGTPLRGDVQKIVNTAIDRAGRHQSDLFGCQR